MKEEKPIGRKAVRQALAILARYKAGKASLERRMVENDLWYRMRHWQCLENSHAVQPVSGWLFNCIANKHAEAMDNFPTANILPREENDRAEAAMLSAVIPAILERCDFEEVYSAVWDHKLRSGTGVFGVFWDSDAHRGLGDISIRRVDPISLFWESGVTDIQASRNLFHVELADKEALTERYPELANVPLESPLEISRYCYDDTIDTESKAAVVDWYYKRFGKLHYCKFVGETVLYATENDPLYASRGLYDHGLYPFLFDPLFRLEGTPCGFGYIDVGKSAQEFIDRGNQAVMMNLLANAKPRYFFRSDGAVNEAEFADLSRDFIHVEGNLGSDSVQPVQASPLNSVYIQAIQDKIEELKQTTGNRDVSTGGTSGGVTAASAIAAMQEAGSKLSRDTSRDAYRVYRRLIYMVIELLRQFYGLSRCFRIAGGFLRYGNRGLLPQHQGVVNGVDLGWRVPEFDIRVTPQKQSPYSKASQNELALRLYDAGFFSPERRDEAAQALELMDFEGRHGLLAALGGRGPVSPGALAAKPPLCKGRCPEGAEGLSASDSVTIPQSASLTAPFTQGGLTEAVRRQTAEAAQPW